MPIILEIVFRWFSFFWFFFSSSRTWARAVWSWWHWPWWWWWFVVPSSSKLQIVVSLKKFSFLLSCFTLLHWLREENPPNKLMSEKLFCLPRLSIERIYRGAAGAGIPARWSSKEIWYSMICWNQKWKCKEKVCTNYQCCHCIGYHVYIWWLT